MGVLLAEDGVVADVVGDSPAWRAGIAPGMKVSRVDGQSWASHVLRRAIERDPLSPVVLVAEDGSRTVEIRLDATDRHSYPHLERNGHPDLVEDILRARTGASVH